jgi:NADP-dependent aldehyde dehydrogenase
MSISGVEILAHSSYRLEANDNCAIPVLISTSMDVLETNTQLLEELFGPSGIVIPLKTKGEMLSFAKKLKGQLTATIHGTEEELSDYGELIDLLEQIAGRVIVNGFPTGVEVCSAMVHGGPFPSTTDSKSTSVGTAAIYRFTRPVCYQNMPQHLLPEELKNKNVLNISRLVNGERSSEDI